MKSNKKTLILLALAVIVAFAAVVAAFGVFTTDEECCGVSLNCPETVKIPGCDYAFGVYEVTQAQYEAVMFGNPSRSELRGPYRPVECVSWNEAVMFCEKLTARERAAGHISERQKYRLPTEEEWEHACRAGTTTEYYTGNTEADLDRVGWYYDNSDGKPHPVGQKIPNAFGLYDMHGNVWEWTSTVRDGSRVIRGGTCGHHASNCGASTRGLTCLLDDDRDTDMGFRVVLAPASDEEYCGVSLNCPETVKIPERDYAFGAYEVTQTQYEAVMGRNPSKSKGPNRPVENVSWNNAVAFCKQLTLRARAIGLISERQRYRLPTEEEWEHACRAGTTTKYYTGDTEVDLDRAGWYGDNSGHETHPVGQKIPNAFGLYDMHGNVREWTSTVRGSHPVTQGGSYCRPASDCDLSSYRLRVDPDGYCSHLGFRVVLAPAE